MTQIEFSSKLISLHDKLSSFAGSLTRNREEANDLIQDTYLKALTNRDKFADDSNLMAWTFTIMKNTFFNNYRSAVRVNILFDHSPASCLPDMQHKSHFASPESQLVLKDIHRGISNLAPTYRKFFEMRNAGYKYKEIADLMGISIGTVKSGIFLARKKLMETLTDCNS
jgi:RNA polymerase sigma factor (sigma-70 family)